MNSQIIKYGSPVLRKTSEIITEDDNVKEMSELLFNIAEKENGIGLACPQIGILKRMFIIDTSAICEINPKNEYIKETYINPEILSVGKAKIYYKEGCLSIPGIYEDVLRSETIMVRYTDINFNTCEENITGLKARVFQHEYDHLNGILFIDKLSFMRKRLLSGKLKQITNSK